MRLKIESRTVVGNIRIIHSCSRCEDDECVGQCLALHRFIRS